MVVRSLYDLSPHTRMEPHTFKLDRTIEAMVSTIIYQKQVLAKTMKNSTLTCITRFIVELVVLKNVTSKG